MMHEIKTTHSLIERERRRRKRALAISFRLFSMYGLDDGLLGHITARDPEHLDCFWVNPFGLHFGLIKVSDLLLVNSEGDVIEGERSVNFAAVAIHGAIHAARPDVIAAAHAHTMYGKTWSSLGRLLDPINQEACMFFDDHVVVPDYGGVVSDKQEGSRIAEILGNKRAAFLQNHGLLTVGKSVEAAAWLFLTMERCCKAQILVESVGTPIRISDKIAEETREFTGSNDALIAAFHPVSELIGIRHAEVFE